MQQRHRQQDTSPDGPAAGPARTGLQVLARLHTDAAAFYAAQLTGHPRRPPARWAGRTTGTTGTSTSNTASRGGTGAGGKGADRAVALLTERAVPAAAVAGYQLGYAPAGWTALTDHLRRRGG
jgi:hypothetical protein